MSLMNKVYFLAKICIDNMKTECYFKSAVSKYVFCGHDICGHNLQCFSTQGKDHSMTFIIYNIQSP